MSSRQQKGNRKESNLSRRGRDEEYRENQDRYGQLNPYPHTYSEYDSHRDMEGRCFGAPEGNSYINDRSHEDDVISRERYRPSFDDSAHSRSFSGRGPKGFKRSDERIKEEVCELLTRHHAIDAEDIEVEVKEGEVTLTGSVPDRRMKHLAEDCAERALGVTDIMNNIRVKRDTSSTSSDTGSASLTGDRTVTGKKSASSSTTSTSNSNH